MGTSAKAWFRSCQSDLDDTKKEFDGMELGIGEVIKIQYFNNEREQNVIVKIETMK